MKTNTTTLLFCLILFFAVPTRAMDLWVSPAGSDRNPGTLEKPLLTIDAARRVIRRFPGRRKQVITVHLMKGVHYLHAALVFDAEDSGSQDSPVIYQAWKDDDVVISGGMLLKFDWKPYRDGIMQARVPNGVTPGQLFVDGKRQPMARFPNFDPNAQYFQGFSKACLSPQRTKKWKNPGGGYLHAMHRALWGDMHWRIAGTVDGELKLEGGWQNNRQMGAHPKYRFVENIFEELDAPGEWYVRDPGGLGLIYYYPPEDVDLENAKIESAGLPHLVEFRGSRGNPVRHISFRGIKFTHTARTFMENKEPLTRSDWTTYRGGAIVLEGTENCALTNCFVDQVGGNGIFVNGYNRRLAITDCQIADAGASAISFVGEISSLRSPLFEYGQTQSLDQMDTTPGPATEDYPADCLVENCLIYRNGRVEKQTAGVNIAYADSITIRHCSIYDCPRAGINICDGRFGGHVIEYNDVFDTVKETGDHGSFNSWGRDRFWHKDRGVTAGWVRQHPEMPRWDARKTTVLRHNRWRCDHGWDIDLDDGSSNYEIYNNLCLAGGIKLREGYFRKVYNNVLVDFTFCPHVWYPECDSSFTRNIIGLEQYQNAGMKTTDQGEQIDFNLIHQEGMSDARPAKALHPFGSDANSIVTDAMFIAPLKGDYRVQKNSPALKLGFKNFPMDNFGVQTPHLKNIARTPALPGTLEAAGIRSGGWGRKYATPTSASWLGATIRGIRDKGEMSSVGLGDTEGVILISVPENSEAFKQGLRESDVIRRLNGQKISDLATFSRIYKEQSEKVQLDVWRNQETTTTVIQ